MLLHGPCGDSAAVAVPGVVTIARPAIGFCGVCGNCCDGGIGNGRVGLGAVVVSEGRSSVKCSVANVKCSVFGCDHQGRVVPLECSLVSIHKIRASLLGFPQKKAMSILIPYSHMVTRMEFWKFNSTMLLVKAELLVQSIRSFFHFHCLALFGLYIWVQILWVDRQLCSQATPH